MSGRMVSADEARTVRSQHEHVPERDVVRCDGYLMPGPCDTWQMAHTVVVQAEQIAAVLALHYPLGLFGIVICNHCHGDIDHEAVNVDWPCPTLRALGATS